VTHRVQAGVSLLELLATLALLGILAMLAIPALPGVLDRTALEAATDDVLLVFEQARAFAITRRVDVGVKWFSRHGDVVLTTYEDGNGNGVLTADIGSGRDRLVAGPVWMRGKYPHVDVTFVPGFSAPDPSGAPIGNLDDPIRFGRSDICTFAPDGHASPGTVYLSDGKARQSAVRVTPANGRIQVLDWSPGARKWIRRK
jgi:prepilin-type N-terminal cleavage/methylation domain-containing protein